MQHWICNLCNIWFILLTWKQNLCILELPWFSCIWNKNPQYFKVYENAKNPEVAERRAVSSTSLLQYTFDTCIPIIRVLFVAFGCSKSRIYEQYAKYWQINLSIAAVAVAATSRANLFYGPLWCDVKAQTLQPNLKVRHHLGGLTPPIMANGFVDRKCNCSLTYYQHILIFFFLHLRLLKI